MNRFLLFKEKIMKTHIVVGIFINIAVIIYVILSRRKTSCETGSSVLEAENKFNKLATEINVHCPNVTRFGKVDDGGWDVCVSEPYNMRNNCLVYSFGIYYDFSFDNDVIKKHNCTVRAYDPSMTTNGFEKIPPGSSKKMSQRLTFYKIGISNINGTQDGWFVKTLGALRKENQESDKTIDILKIDIEYNEWHSINQALQEKSLKNVKQLVMEIHTPEIMSKHYKNIPVTTSETYGKMYTILLQLEVLGFRKYFLHHNPTCKRKSRATGNNIETCFEISYLNINFLYKPNPNNLVSTLT